MRPNELGDAQLKNLPALTEAHSMNVLYSEAAVAGVLCLALAADLPAGVPTRALQGSGSAPNPRPGTKPFAGPKQGMGLCPKLARSLDDSVLLARGNNRMIPLRIKQQRGE